MTYLYIALIILVVLVYLCYIIYQLFQLYYLVHPYKVFLVSSQLEKVVPALSKAISKYTPEQKNFTLVELGSGKAGICRYISQVFDYKEVIGVEGDWITMQMAKVLNGVSKSKAKLINKDFFEYTIPENSVVYCYLFPKLLDRLYERGHFKNQIVLSLTFEISGVEPTEIIEINNFQKKLLVYDFRK